MKGFYLSLDEKKRPVFIGALQTMVMSGPSPDIFFHIYSSGIVPDETGRWDKSHRYKIKKAVLLTADSKHSGTALGTGTLHGFSFIFHGDGLGVFHFSFGFALDAVCFYGCWHFASFISSEVERYGLRFEP